MAFQLESREADIRKLTQQLQQVQRDKSTMELEFSNYRKHTQVQERMLHMHDIYWLHALLQRLLCEATVDKAQEWLDSIQHTNWQWSHYVRISLYSLWVKGQFADSLTSSVDASYAMSLCKMKFNDKELGAWATVFSADKEGLLEKKGAGRGQGK